MDDNLRVLLTGAGAPGGPGIIQALLGQSGLNLTFVDANNRASGRFLAPDKFMQVPHAGDPKFIPEISEICLEKQIDVIIPLVTGELLKLAKNREALASKGTKILLSGTNALRIANNKRLLYDHLTALKLKTPRYCVVSEWQDLRKAVNKLGYPHNPVVVKPSAGNGSRGIRILDENADKFELLFDHKPTHLMSSLGEIEKIIEGKEIPELIVSEFLPGKELTVDTIVANGEVHDLLIRERNTTASGISTSGSFIKNDEVEEYITRIVDGLPGLEGPIGFQVKQSENDGYLLLESNPRLQGTSMAALGMGINIPLRAIKLFFGEKLRPINQPSGMFFVRYYKELFHAC